MDTDMTASIKEALEAARQFVEHAPGSNAKATLVKIDEALASLSCGEATERIAQIVDAYSRGAFTGWKGKTGDSKITLDEAEDHFTLCMQDLKDAILATGCVPGSDQIIMPRALIEQAHAAMRETGWHLAPAHAASGDGVIEAAVAEIEERIATAIRAGRNEE